MKPVTVSVTVPNSCERLYSFLDVLAYHEQFTNHMLVDWQTSGPTSSVGARARMRVNKPGRADWLAVEVIEADPPAGSTEEAVSAHGRRRTRGSYALVQLPTGGTLISFSFTWLQPPLLERLAAPLTRAVMKRGNQRSLQRLAVPLARDGEQDEALVHPIPA